MPRYSYKCTDCDILSDYFHSMTELIRDCEYCGMSDSLVRVPSSFRTQTLEPEQSKVGAIVKAAIKDFKSDLENEKEYLRDKEWTEND